MPKPAQAPSERPFLKKFSYNSFMTSVDAALEFTPCAAGNALNTVSHTGLNAFLSYSNSNIVSQSSMIAFEISIEAARSNPSKLVIIIFILSKAVTREFAAPTPIFDHLYILSCTKFIDSNFCAWKFE